MQLHVRHRTRYLYRAPVSESHNEVRLRPATDDPKRLINYLLCVQPPRRLQHFRDEHRNYVQWFDMVEPHNELIIESTSRIHTTSQFTDGGPPLNISFEDLKLSESMDIMRPFLSSSRYIEVDHEIWRLAIDAQDQRKGVFETAVAIMGFINSQWLYVPNSTSASTHMSEVIHDRRGVCQDFAHVMIGMCRALGIPARYVSGYLYNGPQSHLRGAQASHAWCEVYIPSRGWFGLDPTNNLLAGENYIKIATGRDYEEAAPIRGSFNGPAGATAALEVTVEVEQV